MLGIIFRSIEDLNIDPGPNACVCPTISSRCSGLMRSARGKLLISFDWDLELVPGTCGGFCRNDTLNEYFISHRY